MGNSDRLYRRWHEQEQRCIWCGCWTFLTGVFSKAQARKKLGIAEGEPFGRKRVNQHRATLEHILPKSAGGTNAAVNTVCACHHCNTNRGSSLIGFDPDPEVMAKLPRKVRSHVRRTIQ